MLLGTGYGQLGLAFEVSYFYIEVPWEAGIHGSAEAPQLQLGASPEAGRSPSPATLECEGEAVLAPPEHDTAAMPIAAPPDPDWPGFLVG